MGLRRTADQMVKKVEERPWMGRATRRRRPFEFFSF
jgi:hypothetical protein